MSDTEAIEAAQKGLRVTTDHSLFATHLEIACYHPRLRTIACDGDTDVVECSICGFQRLARCNFDEEYS